MTPAAPTKATEPATTLRAVRSHPVVRNYTLFCLTSLFLLVVCLSESGLEWWCLVPALVGCVSLLLHWNHGPALVLGILMGLLGSPGSPNRMGYGGWSRFQTPTLMDLVLCMAVLGYVVGQYRLLALTRSVFPSEARHSEEGILDHQRRAPEGVKPWELLLLSMGLPVWTGVAVMAWTWMTETRMELAVLLGVPRELWYGLRVIWAALGLMALTGIVSGYLRLTTATQEECLLYLQDQCWRHTRREQGLLNRWLTWSRFRAQRKKEAS